MVKALSYIKGPIKKIQGRSLDIYEVVDVIRNNQTDLRLLRSEESDFYQRCYDYAIRICNLIGIEPSMPRITEKQVHREITPAATPYDYYRVLLKIAATIPVTSCECERSGGVLKILNTYLRASMYQERLTSLAMIHINYDQKMDEEKVFGNFL